MELACSFIEIFFDQFLLYHLRMRNLPDPLRKLETLTEKKNRKYYLACNGRRHFAENLFFVIFGKRGPKI